jgi:hypothetical protein
MVNCPMHAHLDHLDRLAALPRQALTSDFDLDRLDSPAVAGYLPQTVKIAT